ncbi:hypothetical protein HAX54_022818, partial [Datura stramonium]|nr:hypothetical protein [Datura stramonium]
FQKSNKGPRQAYVMEDIQRVQLRDTELWFPVFLNFQCTSVIAPCHGTISPR